MAKGIHTEETLETLIEAYLIEAGGYEKGAPTAYDRTRAMLPQTVLAYIQDTQPKVWEALRAIHKDKLEPLFMDGLGKALEQQGTLEVLRRGVKFYGQTVKLAEFEPAHRLNPGLWVQFEKNRLTVVRQVKYDPSNENELDLVSSSSTTSRPQVSRATRFRARLANSG